jgi:exonuclease SbcD
MERLRARFPHALVLHFAPSDAGGATARPPTQGRSAHEVSLDFVRHVRGAEATPDEAALLREALECCSEDPDLVPGDAVVSG